MYSKDFKIGKQVKEEREKKKITQEQLAKLSNLSPNYISKMENDTYTNIGSKHLIDICNALHISMAELFGDDKANQCQVSDLPLNVQELILSLNKLQPAKQKKIIDTIQPLVNRLTAIIK